MLGVVGEVPPRLSVVPLTVPANVSREIANTVDLAGWDAPARYPVGRQLGDAWYDQRRTAATLDDRLRLLLGGPACTCRALAEV